MDKMNIKIQQRGELVYDISQLNLGDYDIQFKVNEDIKNILDPNEVESARYISSINGAVVKNPKDSHLEYRVIVDNDRDINVLSVEFTIPKDDMKLGHFLSTSPYGLIKKNRTGVGATTLELSSPRNSIVVVPTRSLAYEKAKKSKIEGTDKYKVLYVGGAIDAFPIPKIEDYLADEEIEYKKFIVVIDSLDRLLNIVGEEHYKDYFIMFDEIDSYQYDSNYREKMELNFDYYFKFPRTKRCLVSATVGRFSNPLIEKEPVINISFNKPISRNISLIHTDDVIVRAVNTIKDIVDEYPNDKILIAFNSVKRGMLPIIKSLPEELQSQCAILCSTRSKPDVEEYYSDIINRTLPKKITFMSCVFFVGIDIEERFHLVSIADVNYPYTLLSTHKLYQIAGRCRHEEGLLSETLIYNTSNYNEDINYDILVDNIRYDAECLASYANYLGIVTPKFPKLFQPFNRISNSEIIKDSLKSYKGSSSLQLVRESIEGIKPAYFNIDNIIIQAALKNMTYSDKANIKKALQNEGYDIIEYMSLEEKKHVSNEIVQEIKEQCFVNEEDERESFIKQLKEQSTIEDREKLAKKLLYNTRGNNADFLEHFIELQEYVPFDTLVNLLPEHLTPQSYNDFYNAVIIWALDNSHPIRISINKKFPKGESLSGAELVKRFNDIWNGILHYGALKHNQAMRRLNIFCKVAPRTHIKEGNVYPITGYDNYGLGDNCLKRIPSNTNLTKMLKIR